MVFKVKLEFACRVGVLHSFSIVTRHCSRVGLYVCVQEGNILYSYKKLLVDNGTCCYILI